MVEIDLRHEAVTVTDGWVDVCAFDDLVPDRGVCVLAGSRKYVARHPVATKRVIRALYKAADLCASEPEPFFGVGMWYEDFSQTTDEEVRNLLAQNNDHAKAR